MQENTDNPKPTSSSKESAKIINLIGYPHYPVNEDIYNKSEKMEEVDPENIAATKQPNEEDTGITNNEIFFKEDISGNDLDVPGAEIDDEQEMDGNEDEENNYYSLGGDEHNDLDEDHWE